MKKFALSTTIFLFLIFNICSDTENNKVISTAIEKTEKVNTINKNNTDNDIGARIYEANLKKSPSKTNSTNTDRTSPLEMGQVTIQNNNKFYTISDFIIPDGYELHIKLWINGKETKEYYEYIPEKGINDNGTVRRYPVVDALCCIKYGKKGDSKPFSIDLNRRGKGKTDLPGCQVNETIQPSNSISVNLPAKVPNTNL